MNEPRWRSMAEKNTILRVLVGSQAYGLSVEGGGDRDEKGVCIEPLEVHIGFSSFEQYEYRSAAERTGQHDAPSQDGDLDLTLYSLHKFLRLALKGNPTIVEMLFIKNYLSGTNAAGMHLQELAPYLVSKQAGKAYLGYMQAQRQRLLGERGGKDVNRPELVERFGFDVKYAMHMLRLGLQGVELLSTGTLVLPVVGKNRDFLLGVRQGLVPFNDCLTKAGELEVEVKDLLNGGSPLPDEPNTPYVEDWMVRRYWEWWKAQRVLYDRAGTVQ